VTNTPIHPVGPKLMFWGISDRFVTPRKSMQNRPNLCNECKRSCNEVALEFSQRTHPIHPIGPQTLVLGCFGPFHYCMKVGAKQAELVQLMHPFVQQSRIGIFHNEHTRSNLLDPKNMFLERFGLFCYCKNFDAKQAEHLQLMHKFLPRSHVRIFHNERTRSNPLDPKLMFCSASQHFVTT
jgi:hypothetical protein